MPPRRRRRPRASRASSRPESASFSRASRRSRLSATNPRRDDDVPDDDDRYDDRYDRRAPREPRKGTLPDVTLLTQREVQSLIPVGATGEQYAHFWGGAETAVQRLGFSLSDSSPRSTPPPSSPSPPPRSSSGRRWRSPRGVTSPRVAGETSDYGARESSPWTPARRIPRPGSTTAPWTPAEALPDEVGGCCLCSSGTPAAPGSNCETPLARRHADIREGDEVELVVGSDDNYFARFEAVREAYFPRTGTWVGEYPFLDRRAMPRVSARIARDAADRNEWYARRGGGGDAREGGYEPYD